LGAGAVGGYAIRLARRAGLDVLTDSREEDGALVRSLGADHVVPCEEPMAAGVRELYPDRVDGLIDTERIGRTQRPLFTPGVRR
jgi:NADPH:quinone reductase-like Zn-dependent oxidoreductase